MRKYVLPVLALLLLAGASGWAAVMTVAPASAVPAALAGAARHHPGTRPACRPKRCPSPTPTGTSPSPTPTTTSPSPTPTTTSPSPTPTATSPSPTPTATSPSPTPTGTPPGTPAQVCGSASLNSPWDYTGPAGPYASGTAGLPTYGAAGTDFPDATSGTVVPAGDNTAAGQAGDYGANNAVYYFEPGLHQLNSGAYTGDHSAYAGGYTAAAGPAVLDGGGQNSRLSSSKIPADGTDNVADTWEYLTVRNFTSDVNGSVLGLIDGGTAEGAFDAGDTYAHDTIGPNEYAYAPGGAVLNTESSPGHGGGYAIGLADDTTITGDCITGNAQGGFDGSGTGISITGSEIARNGLGLYPDAGGTGASPHACGCSGGGKLFFSVNADITGNWVHHNYNAGVWLDTNNTGADISSNTIASNWGQGIAYEASYNALISDNTISGNGWASDGPWPSGYNGNDSCFGGVPCSGGLGPINGTGGFPYASLYMNASGGNSDLVTVPVDGAAVTSRYQGAITVTNNNFTDNFGGVGAYTDAEHYDGNPDNFDSCQTPLDGASSTYYQQSKELTAGSATISGAQVTAGGPGTVTLCSDYGHDNGGNGAGGAAHPAETGMGVFDEGSGAFLGNVASVASATSFTLDRSPGDATGRTLALSAYGGCGLADYYGASKPGDITGSPPAAYWDNCLWGSRNVKVTSNTFTTDPAVTNCSAATECGFQFAFAFLPGIADLFHFWYSYPSYIALAPGGTGNDWSSNTYTGQYGFEAGNQGTVVSLAQWQAGGQDAGSTFTP